MHTRIVRITRTLSPVFLFLLLVGSSAGGAFAARPSEVASEVIGASDRPDVSIWCVDATNGLVGSPCTNGSAILSLQAAVDGAIAGDEIRIRSGTYTGGSVAVVTVGINLTFIGGFPGGATGWSAPSQPPLNPDSTIIDAQGVSGRTSVQIDGAVNVGLHNLALVNGGVRNNSGTVRVGNSYTLRIRNGGNSNGAFDVALGSFVAFTAGTHSLSDGVSFIGAGTMLVDGGTVTALGTLTIQNLDLVSGTLNGDAPSVININSGGTFDWGGPIVPTTSTMGGTGVTNIPPGVVLNLGGVSSTRILSSRTLNNRGTAIMNGTGEGSLRLGGGALFDNQSGSVFTIVNNDDVIYNSGAQSYFVNHGTVNKSGGVGTGTCPTACSMLGSGFLSFDNLNTVNIITGTLSLNGGTDPAVTGGHTGPFLISPGATLAFGGTRTDLALGTSSITGNGNVLFGSGTVNIAGNYNITGAGSTTIAGGTVNFDADASTSNLNITTPTSRLSSTVARTFTISDYFNWDAGEISGPGIIDMLATSAFTSTLDLGGLDGNTKTLLDRVFISRGNALTSSTGTGTFAIGRNAVFTNTGTFDIQNNDSIKFAAGTTAARFANTGTVRKSGGAGNCPPPTSCSSLGENNLAFNNYNIVVILTGTLRLAGGTFGGNTDGHTGSFTVAPLSTLLFDSGTRTDTLQPSSRVTGEGNFTVQSGVVDHYGTYNITGVTSVTGGAINFNGAATSSLANLSGTGTIGGSGVFTVTDTLNWTGGNMNGLGGRTSILSTTTVNLGGVGATKKLIGGRTFNNAGMLLVNGTNTGSLRIGSGATFNNLAGATFNIQNNYNDDVVDDGGTESVFNNYGRLVKSGGTGTCPTACSTLGSGNLKFNNQGAVDLTAGTLSLDGGTSGGTTGGHTGVFNVTTPSALRFGGGTHWAQSTASILGDGNVEFATGSTVHYGGSYNITGATLITGGTFDVTSAAVTNDAILSAGTLDGGGVFTVTGTLTWTGGRMIGLGGRTEIPAGAIANIGGLNAGHELLQRTFNNRGTVNTNGTGNDTFSLNNGATFNNNGTFNIQNNVMVNQTSGAPSTFNNNGTLLRAAGTGMAKVGTTGMIVNNNGTIEVLTGELNFGSLGSTCPCYRQQGETSTLHLNGGNVSNTAPLSILGGSIRGTGVITGSVTNTGGTFSPAGQGVAGQLAINGVYVQNVGGAMHLELGGTAPATEFDKMPVTGQATLSGTLKVRTINSFVPTLNMTFTVMTYASHVGCFTNLDTALGGGLYALPVCNATNMYLRITNTGPTSTPTSVGGTATPTRTGTPPTSTPSPTRGSATVTVTPCPMNFSDVVTTDYFYIPVRYLFCAGVISGYVDGTFRPYNNTTRGQLCKIVALAEGWTLVCPETPHFNDVSTANPFYCHIETAYGRGVIGGYSDGTFRPGNNVTRAQLSKIVVLAEEWAILCPTTSTFSDVPVGDTFFCQIETAFAHGIISGYADGTFRPGNPATRGQICKIVYQAVTGP